MKFYFSKQLYNKDALLKAAYSFTDVAYVHLDADEVRYIADVNMKEHQMEISEFDFQNEVLAQMVRQSVFKQTKEVRELLFARAFSSTIINNSVDNCSLETEAVKENIEEADILMDWFEKYE